MAVKYTQTYKTYEDAAAEARRAQAMAEMLQQQAYQPIQINPAGPISYTQGLAKILEGITAAREEKKARQAEAESKRIGREEFKDYMSAFEPERATTPVEMATASPAMKQRMELKPQNLDLGQIAQGMGTPTISEQGAMGYTPPTGKLPSAEPMQFTTGSLTPGQRRAKLLEGAFSGNPAIAAFAQKEYDKPSMLGKIGDVAPDKFTPASLAQYQATGNAAVLVPVERENKAPTAVQEYEYAQRQGYKGSFRDFQNERARAGASTTTVSYGAPVAGVDESGKPVFFQPAKEGGKPSIVPGVRPKPEAMGANESNAALFADRMVLSAPVLDTLPPPSVTAGAKAGVPGIGNILTSDKNRQFLQAERNFITAVLRKESGAAISEGEYEQARRLYIPQAGDDAQTLQMKKQARDSAIAGIARGAGPTYKPPTGTMPSASSGWGKAEPVR